MAKQTITVQVYDPKKRRMVDQTFELKNGHEYGKLLSETIDQKSISNKYFGFLEKNYPEFSQKGSLGEKGGNITLFNPNNGKRVSVSQTEAPSYFNKGYNNIPSPAGTYPNYEQYGLGKNVRGKNLYPSTIEKPSENILEQWYGSPEFKSTIVPNQVRIIDSSGIAPITPEQLQQFKDTIKNNNPIINIKSKPGALITRFNELKTAAQKGISNAGRNISRGAQEVGKIAKSGLKTKTAKAASIPKYYVYSERGKLGDYYKVALGPQPGVYSDYYYQNRKLTPQEENERPDSGVIVGSYPNSPSYPGFPGRAKNPSIYQDAVNHFMTTSLYQNNPKPIIAAPGLSESDINKEHQRMLAQNFKPEETLKNKILYQR